MVRFLSLSLEGFRSFRGEQTLTFPDGPGFHLMSGRNRVTPRLGGNGTGKSSVWDGLAWTLYGRTARGLKAGDVGNWQAQDLTTGTLEFRRGSRYYTLRRTWNPNSLVLQRKGKRPRTVTQQQVDELVGLTHPAFLSCVLMGQFNRFFFDLSAAEKLQVFSDALGLDYWVGRADRAKRLAKDADASVRDFERDESSARARQETLFQTRAELKKSSARFEDERQRQVGVLEAFLDQKRPDVKRADAEVVLAVKRRRRAESQMDVLNRRSIAADDECRTLERGIAKDEATRNRNRDVRRAYRREQARLYAAKDVCPTCGQPMSKEHFGKEFSRLAAEQERAGERERASEKLAEDGRHLLATKERERTKHVDGITALQPELRRLRSEEQAARKRWEEDVRALKAREEQLRRLRDETPPHREQLEKVERDLAIAEDKLKHVTEDLAATRVRLTAYQQWATLFKELRLWLVEEAVAQLEVEVNNSLTQLGLDGWTIRCNVERENKQGNVTRGFAVTVRSPESGKRPVKWEAWCGGETQRLRVAGALGLQRLMLDRLGADVPIEVWDEPTAHLSEEGVTDLLQFFEGRSREERRQVWIVDHRSLKAGNFDGEVRVVRDEAGSKIVQA